MATTELAKAYVQIVPSVQGISSELDTSLQSIVTSANNAESAVNSVGSAAGSTSGDLDALGSDASGAAKDVDAVGDAARGAGSDLDSLASDADSAGSDLDDLGASADDAGSDIDSMASDAGSASSDLDDLGSSADDTASSFDSLGDSASNALSDVGGLGQSLGGTFTSSSTEASNAFSGLSNTMSAFATGGIAAGVTTAVAAIGTGLYNVATESQDARTIIAQGTGAIGDDLDDMASRAKSALTEVSLSSSTSLTEISGALAEINTRFGYTDDQLQEVTVTLSDFAAVTGQDSVAAVDAIADAMNGWNMSAEDMPGLLDDIVTASQKSGASAEELEAALSENAAAFSQVGMSAEDALSFLGAYTKSTGDASDANTILKSAINNLTGEVDDVPGAFQDAIKAIQQADSASSALTAEVGDTGLTIQDVFGSKNANKMIQAVQSEAFALDDMTAALAENEGAMEQTAEASVTFKDKVQGAFDSLKMGVSNAMSSIKDFFTGTRETGEAAGEGLVEGLESSTSGVSSAAKDIGNALVDGVNDTLQTHSPSRVLMETGNDVTNGLIEGMSGFADAIQEPLTDATNRLKIFNSDATSEISSTTDNVSSNAKKGFSPLSTVLDSPLSTALSATKSWGSNMTNESSSAASNVVSKVKNGLASFAATVESPLTSALSITKSWGSSTESQATTSGKNFVTNLNSGMSSLTTKVNSILQTVTSDANTWGSNLTSSFKSIGGNIVDGITNAINNKVSSLCSSIKSMCQKAVQAAEDALGIGSPSKVFRYQVGEQIGEGLALGIEDSEGVVTDAMDDLLTIPEIDTAGIGFAATGSTAASAGNAAVYNVTQNIYSQAQTAASLMREARYEARRAVMQGV